MQEQHTQPTSEKSSPEKSVDTIEAIDRLHQIAAHLHVLLMATASLEDENDQDAMGQICADALKRCRKALAALSYKDEDGDVHSVAAQFKECSTRLRRILERMHGGCHVERSISRSEDSGTLVYMFEVRLPLDTRQ